MSSFHDIVFALRPKNQKTKSTTYWVAILKSVVQPESSVYREEDFLWIKCHGSISIKTIYEQYITKHPEDGDIKLKLGIKLPSGTTSIRDLDEFNDRLIVLEAFKDSDPSARASVERLPLQQIQHQVTVKPNPVELGSRISASIPKYQVSNPALQDENIRPSVRNDATSSIGSHWPSAASPAQSHPYQPGENQPALNEIPYLEPSHALTPEPRSSTAYMAPDIPVDPTDSLPAAADVSPTVALPNSSQYVVAATPEWAIPQGFEIFVDKHQEKYRLRDPSLNAGKSLPGKNHNMAILKHL